MPSHESVHSLTSADDLIKVVESYNPKCNRDKIRAAFELCQRAHEGQLRHSGEPYYTHPVAVAEIIARMRLDDTSLITALLHDTIEDTGISYDDICAQFGDEVGNLVDGVTKLTQLELSSTRSKEAENLRKLFMAMSRDLRVILVKLSDRLHNMRTISYMPADKQLKKVRETIEIYAPLAGRIGMQEIREELEELAFEIMNPETQATIQRRLVDLRGDPDAAIEKISDDIRAELNKAGIKAKLQGRAKKPYSVWRKIEEKKKGFSKLSDIYAFRVIVQDQAECYKVLGVVHACWYAVPGRFKDYISQPKSNGYRSLHTTVSGRDGKHVEIQIRTQQMHEVAKTGVAAHWSYRDGERINNPFTADPANWVNALNAQIEEGDTHDDFLEQMKLEIYTELLFVFTPKGDVIQLPQGATPLDFAYAIHTRIGHTCVGVKVDGVRQPLWSELQTGQYVEIICAEGQSPQSSWLQIAKTGRARGAIRHSLRAADHARFLRFGKELTKQAFQKHGRRLTENALKRAARQQGERNSDDLLVRVGREEISAYDIVKTMFPDAELAMGVDIAVGQEVIGVGRNAPYELAQCCQALPGERIVGIIKPGMCIHIHRIDCDALMGFDAETWTDLRWKDGQHPPIHIVTLGVTMGNTHGVLGRICTFIGQQNVNISDVKCIAKRLDFFIFEFSLELRDIRHLHSVVTALEADSDVASVCRHGDGTSSPDNF